MKPFIIITGMHRSGTSFLARALNLCGVFLGPYENFISTELKPARDNLKGHWENKEFLELCEKSLEINNGSWDNPPSNYYLNNKLGQIIKSYSNNLLNYPMLAAGFKDPRMCLLFESWSKYLPNNLIPLGIFRHPLKVAESLKIRNNFTYEKSLSLWEFYNKKLLFIIKNQSGFLFNFDWTLPRLISEIHEVADKFGLIENTNLSQWFSSNLLSANKSYDSDYPLPLEISRLYEALKKQSEKNNLIKYQKIFHSKQDLVQTIQSLLNEINDQSIFFRNLNK